MLAASAVAEPVQPFAGEHAKAIEVQNTLVGAAHRGPVSGFSVDRPMSTNDPLRTFVTAMTHVVERHDGNEAALLDAGASLLGGLVASDDWLAEAYAVPSADRYRQYLLHLDARERFSVVSFVWRPTQRTPIHDHLTWGLIGQLRGEEVCEEYAVTEIGISKAPKFVHRLRRGEVDRVSPRIGDVHAVSHGGSPGAAISIHVYGANIGAIRRHTFDPATGTVKEFVSGYDNA